MYLSKKFGVGAAVLGVALASCQLLIGCGSSDDSSSPGGAGASEAGGAGKAGASASGGKGGAETTGGTAGESAGGTSEMMAGAGGETTGGSAGAGVSGGGAGGSAGAGVSGGGAGGSAGTGVSGGGAGGSAGTGVSGGGAGGSAGTGVSGGGAGGSAGTGVSGGGAGGSAGTGVSGGGAGGSAGAGVSGGGAGGSAAAVCGDGIVETGEVCDPKFTTNDCGSDCKAITAPTCFACENDETTCSDFVSCDIAIGNAAAGTPAAGVPKSNLCNEVLDCARDSGCAINNAPVACYCGTANATDCQSGLANGACRTQLERGLETTTPATIIQRLKNVAYGGGVAMGRIDCDQTFCVAECGLE